MAPTGLLESFLAALQASLSVLLVILYGGIASHLQLLDPKTTKTISKVCVRMFLPALLLTKIGAELHAGSAHRYGLVLAWALLCHAVSFAVGIAAHLLGGLPDWTTVALMFNNTISYPLLLVGALQETGILRTLVTDPHESTDAALERMKSYFLVFATVSSCLTFAVGPRLIDSEHAPEPEDDKEGLPAGEEEGRGPVDGADDGEGLSSSGNGASEETGLLDGRRSVQFTNPFAENSFYPSNRRPVTDALTDTATQIKRRASLVPKRHWARLGPRTKWWLLFISDFFNAPMLGALVGAIIGLSPPLHRAFFNSTEEGGIFTAWLTASLKTIGAVFVPLPIVVAGVSLYSAVQSARQKRRASQGPKRAGLPWGTALFVLIFRFVLWPAVSISVIYALASRTEILGDDPMLWFAMMLMPTGPPAMKLITLVQVSDAGEEEEEIIAKLLTVRLAPLLTAVIWK